MSVRIARALLAALLLVPSQVAATCYWQNSTLAPDSPYSIAPDDTACFPDQTNSPCCGTGWTCLSDGVCFIQQGSNDFYYRGVGTCTDRTWNSQQCPGWYFAQNSTTSIPLAKCQTADGEDWYCCPGDPNCDCQSGKDAVKLGASQPTTVTVIGSTSWPGIQSQTGTFSTSAFANTNQNTRASTAASTSVISSGTVSRTMSSTMTTSTTRTSGAAAGQASGTSSPTGAVVTSSSGSNTDLAAGLGAGLGVAAIAIAALAFFLFRKRRRDQAAARPQSTVPPYTTEMAGSTPGGPAQQTQHSAFYGGAYNTYPSSEMAVDGRNTRSEMPGSHLGTRQYKPLTDPDGRHELDS